MKLKRYWAWILLILVVLSYTLTLSCYSIRRHQAFASSYDLANMDQTVWNTSRGRPFTLSGVTGTVSRFQFHADLLLVLIAPLYWLVPKVEALLVLQSAIIGLAAIPIFLLGKLILKDKLKALLVSIAFLMNAGVMWSNIYDFHSVSLSMTFLLFAFYFTYTKIDKWMWIFSFLTLLTKENMGIYLLALGLYSLIIQRRKVGYLMSAIGIVWTWSMIFVVMPRFADSGEHWAWDWFRFDNLNNLFAKVFNKESLDYLKLLLKLFGFVPLLGLPWIIFSAPDLIMNIISSQGQMRSIVFHYDSVIVVGLVISTIMGWKYFNDLVMNKNKLLGWIPGVILIVFAARTNFNYGPLPYTPSHWRPMFSISEDEIAFEKALQNLPAEASVTSSSEVRAHVTHRENSYNLPNMVEAADYIAMVDQNRIVGNYEPKDFETDLIKKLIASPKYSLEFQQGHFYLFKKLADKDVLDKE